MTGKKNPAEDNTKKTHEPTAIDAVLKGEEIFKTLKQYNVLNLTSNIFSFNDQAPEVEE